MRDHDELRARLLATEIVRAFEVKLRVWGDKLPNSAVSDFMATVTWANAALARQEEGQPAPASPQGVSEAVETIKRIAAQLAVDDCEGDAADLIDALHDLTAAGQQAAGVSEEIVERLKIAARAIIRERKVYAEDVETLADVLRTLESLAAGRNEPAPGTTLRFGMGAFIVNTGAHAGEPAVFVDAAQEPGAVGEAAPTIPAGTTPLLRLLFPTKEQAQLVADALVNVTAAGAAPEGWVLVPKDWYFGAQEFIAKFTSGNSVPVDVKFVAARSGPTISQEATYLRDMLAATPNPGAQHGQEGRE